MLLRVRKGGVSTDTLSASSENTNTTDVSKNYIIALDVVKVDRICYVCVASYLRRL
jgi:hypothetical protein